MAKFVYRAVSVDGVATKGVVTGQTMAAVRAELESKKLHIEELKEKKGILQLEITRRKIGRDEVMNFTRQLGAFMRAGVPILDSLEVIAEESTNPTLREVLRNVHEALRGGDTLSAAIQVHERFFPKFYVDMLRSAELTGHLDYVLDQLARYIERDLEAKRKIRAAMAYPAVILVASMGTVIILTAFVLPRFRSFFSSLNATLPLPTRMLLGGAGLLARWWWLVTGFWILLAVGIWQGLKTAKGRELRDRMLLRLPVIGGVVRFAIIERFCRILSSMLQAGVPLPEAMSIVGEGTNNIIYTRAIDNVREQMLEGEGIARPIAATGLFPASVIQMMRVGESTGTLDEQLESAATFFDRELEYKLKKLTTLFEPAVIVLMGVIVGFVAVALISAMYGIFQQTGKIG